MEGKTEIDLKENSPLTYITLDDINKSLDFFCGNSYDYKCKATKVGTYKYIFDNGKIIRLECDVWLENQSSKLTKWFQETFNNIEFNNRLYMMSKYQIGLMYSD